MDTPIEAILEFSFLLTIVDVNESKGNHSWDGFGVTEAPHQNGQTTNSNSLPEALLVRPPPKEGPDKMKITLLYE
jgi:hypothetical protein